MPELPDVEVFKRYLDVTALHKTIKKVKVKNADILNDISIKKFQCALQNETMTSSRRHGKYIFVNLAQEKWLYMHFGMTGELKYYKHEEDEPKYAQVVHFLANNYILSYISRRKLGTLSIIKRPACFIDEKPLGPDALALDFDRFKTIFTNNKSAVKSGLMNQQRIAGIGNIYSDEILFQAGVHPRKKMNTLAKDEFKALFKKMRRILTTAIDREADPEQLPDSYLLPHRRKDGRCPKCGSAVKNIKVSGRSGYFCPQCQRK